MNIFKEKINIIKVPKYNRQIVVDDKIYEWAVSLENSGYHVYIRHANTPGQILHIENLPVLAQDQRWGQVEEEVEFAYSIKEMIQTAIRHGWQPGNPLLDEFIL